MGTPETNISYNAWIPITTPTAVTILKWLYLSDLSAQPIFENKSDPLQQTNAIMEHQNHNIFLYLFSFIQFPSLTDKKYNTPNRKSLQYHFLKNLIFIYVPS